MNDPRIRIAALFVGACLLIGLGIIIATLARSDGATGNEGTTALGHAVEAQPTPTPSPPALADSTPASTPDFIVTDQLRAHKPTWEEVGQGPTRVSFCEGQKGNVSNGTNRLLNLNVVPAESDDTSGLGTVKPAESLVFDVGEVGTWNILDADDGMPLFQYEVTKCGATETATPAKQVTSDAKQGKCRLTVDGTRYIDGTCEYSMLGAGGFQMWELGMANGNPGYIVNVMPSGDTADGAWNESREVTHPETSLGTLRRHGACWSNETSEVCLWAK